ncbi:MAG: phosphoribosylanthranilate isomerase [Parvibaculaceae bacterium]|nr:phosphoribosylanthranilate isomerase [Parvibaculaceae bacterium]
MSVKVKICGLTSEEAVTAVSEAGADYAGFVFYPPSPRHLTVEHAAGLAAGLDESILKVALTVDADDRLLDQIMNSLLPDVLQLQGKETPGRVAMLGERYGRAMMKAIGIENEADLGLIAAYREAADLLLLDAKPPKSDRTLPGGNGLAFDWGLISARRIEEDWLLAGGLTPENVAEAIRVTGAPGVDVSSGVESAPGVKDPALIAAFVRAAKAAAA